VDYDLEQSDYGKIRLTINQYTTGTTDKEYNIGTFDPHSGSYTFTHTETIGDDWENIYVSVSLYAAKQGEPLPAEYTDFDYKHYPVGGKGGGSLLQFDLDYKGTEPASGNVMHMFYKEGNAGNQYIIRAYPEWDQNSFILNSDNDESISELAQEMGGHRYDVENYIIPSVPGEYKIKVVYSSSITPPTWDNYNRLLGEFTLMVRDDGTGYLNFDWDVSSPSTSCGIGSDFFSGRWTRSLNFDSGTWRFTATTDDGMRVYVDGSLVIDKWFNQVATTYGKEIKFTGTVLEYKGSGPGQQYCIVSVDKVISGPQPCDNQLTVFLFDPEYPPPWGYVDPSLKVGDTVEVFGKYIEGDWGCSVTLHGSTDYYIRASGPCATKTVTLHYPKEKGLSEVFDFETGDVFKWGDKPWSEFQIWTLGDNTICGECAHFVDMGTVDICSTEPPPYSTKTYDIPRLNPKVGYTYGVALGCPVKECTQIHILACDGNSVTFGYEEEELPDLTLLSDDISFSNPSPAVGETVTITAIIHNIGTISANDVIVQFFDGDPDNSGTQIGVAQTIASITAGGTGTAQVDWTATAGSHDIYVIVDPYDDIPELDENNNEAHINCEVEVLSGSLTVTVMNAAGKSLPDCGGTIEVQLYDKDLIPIETESQTYSGGESSVQVQFDNLANEQHFIEVYHTPNSDLKLKEYWGKDEVTVSGSTPKDFVRHTQVVYDVKINGESPYENEIVANAGEQVHVDITVKNFEAGTLSKNVEVGLILDQDKIYPHDFGETHRPISILQNGEDDFGFDFYPEEAGTYYFYIIVHGEYNSNYIVVDQHDWYKAVLPPSSLTLTVMNAANKPLPDCGGTINVVLYDKDYNHIERSQTYLGGESSVQVQFDNLANEQHFIHVLHTPNSDLKLGEFWGKDEVTVSGSTPKDFVRHTQVVYDVKINGECPYENEIEVNAGEQVHVDITVKNFEAESKNVKVQLILDHDKSFPYDDFDETQGGSIPQNGEEDFEFDFYPPQIGNYYFYIVVCGEYSSFEVVDQHDWYKAFASSSQLPDLTFSYEDEYSSDGISIDPDVLEVGEPVKIKVAVQNVIHGTTITDNFYVNFYLGDPDMNDDGVIDDNANEIGSYPVEAELPLLYNEVIYPWTTWTPTEVGTFAIYVVIDPEIDTTNSEIGSVVECVEGNNEAQTEIDFEVEYWAVLVGGTADQSTEDVIALKNVLESNFNFDENQNLKCLIESDSTKEKIEEEINWMNESADENAVCLFFFSGHGEKTGRPDQHGDPACIWDYNNDPIFDTELEEWFKDFKTNNLLFIFDSCHSGGMISNLEGSGRAILTCAKDYLQPCKGHDDFSHGEFSFYIIQGLYGAANDNNDNSISPNELFDFANSRMEHSNPAESIDSGFEFFIHIKASTMQENINKAPSGTTINIPPGTYNEHLFINKPLTLIGDNVIIDGEGLIGGALIYSDNVNIEEFAFQNCGYAIYLDSSNECEISNNDLIASTSRDGCSVFLGLSNKNSISHNTISMSKVAGIMLKDSNENLITKNKIYNNGENGIFLEYSDYSEIKSNDIYANEDYGIESAHSKYSVIKSNDIHDNGCGLYLYGTSYNLIKNNDIHDNDEGGGLFLLSGESNQIYHNNFYDNTISTRSESDNQWDNGYPSGGNYWSYIDCPDLKHGENQDITGGDGICDNPYTIPVTENDIDHYPFKNKNGWQIQIDGICNPIELILTDPDGLTISKEENEIPDATYTELDIDGDDDLDDRIIIADRKLGDYQITVIPKHVAEPTDTFTLEVMMGDTTTVLAENVPVSEIPAEPYIFKSGMN
jgi:parallel beta-helix repeat protein